MNKIKYLFIILMLLIFINVKADNYSNNNYSFIYSNSNGYIAKISDNANLISNTNIDEIRENMVKLTNYGNIEILTINEYINTREYASNYYHNNYGVKSGTLFLIDMFNREIYIFSEGYNYTIINSSKAKIITDNSYRYAINGDYYSCINNSIKEIFTLLDGGKINENMRIISSLLLSVSLGFIISFIYISSKSNIKKERIDWIIKNCNKEVNISEFSIEEIGMHHKLSRSSYDNDSSDSSSSGGSIGKSSGGGGGHGF